MRKKLFKGKGAITGDWICGFYADGVILTSLDIDEDYFGTSEEWESVLEETVGEYIGLSDKLDNKIFEGDIVKFGTQQYEIKWNAEQCCFGFWTGNSWQSGCNKDTLLVSSVVGNIHN